ncbi:MAG: hypothetical protein BRC22_00055 [Parcubacteria group bacterium QH_9_35_7]|nr:MAG: hypothetical protein BRC22_00055 [Parcubacteria group bacterium QH_9_35_7]
MSQKIAKNTAYMTIASILQKVIAFLYFTLIARYLGAGGTGKYFFALSFTTIFVIFVDMGFNNVLIRESAKLEEQMQNFFSTVLSAKMVFAVLTYIATVAAINLMGYPEETRHLVYLSGVTMLFDSFHQSNYGVLRAIGNLKWEAFGMVGSQLITLVLGTTFLFLGFPLIFLILAFTIPSILNVIYSASVLFYKYEVKFLPRFNKHTFFKLGKIAIPFALAAIFSRIYSRADTIILSKLAGDQAVGWYSIPKKISNAFRFLPMALIASVYPKFSEYYKDNKEKLAYLLERSLKYLMLLVFPISVGIMLLSQDIVITIYTEEFVRSILPLKVLMISLFFSFISFPLGAFLNACDRQKTQTAIVGIVMTVNVILNLILIPKFSVLGAAISALVGNLLLAVLGYYFVPKITDISHKFLISCGAKIGSAAALMGIIVWWINMFVHFLITIVVGAAVYFAVLYLFGIITKELVQEARNLFKS